MAAPTNPGSLNDALRRLHRTALGSIALCGIAIGVIAFGGDPMPAELEPGESRWVALALATVAIFARRSPALARRGLRPFIYGSVLSLVCCTGLGVLGVWMATTGQPQVGGLYALAGAILLIRGPAQLVEREAGPEETP